MKITYENPPGKYSRLCDDLMKQSHVMIAGTTGSGKSTLIEAFIVAVMYHNPARCGVVLIDPKRVELRRFRNLPHSIEYASDYDTAEKALKRCEMEMARRYRRMERAGVRQSGDKHIYIIIDEFADLVTDKSMKKNVTPTLCRIAQLGRAANIHLILATQRPTRDVVCGQIAANIDARIALRCPTAQDSRNIIHQNGAEMLPKVGKGLYLTPETMKPVLVDVPLTPPEEIKRLIDYWNMQRPRWFASFFWHVTA